MTTDNAAWLEPRLDRSQAGIGLALPARQFLSQPVWPAVLSAANARHHAISVTQDAQQAAQAGGRSFNFRIEIAAVLMVVTQSF
jgi:hypothetical protein